MFKRGFDFIFSLIGLIIFSPVMLCAALLIKLTSKGPVIYRQIRSGKGQKAFYLYKFRTMVDKADTMGTSVTTDGDPRITPVGRFLRKSKLDELPQLFNVLLGDMSFVGPRPDVPEITIKYTTEMKRVFDVRPGITSLATLHFRHEEDILAGVDDPDKFYEDVVVPLKINLSLEHARHNSFWFDLGILFQTIWVLTPFGKVWPIKENDMVTEFRRQYCL